VPAAPLGDEDAEAGAVDELDVREIEEERIREAGGTLGEVLD
jgi:hypothetical protein